MNGLRLVGPGLHLHVEAGLPKMRSLSLVHLCRFVAKWALVRCYHHNFYLFAGNLQADRLRSSLRRPPSEVAKETSASKSRKSHAFRIASSFSDRRAISSLSASNKFAGGLFVGISCFSSRVPSGTVVKESSILANGLTKLAS